MDVKEKLVEILGEFLLWPSKMKNVWMPQGIEKLADHLISHGVTVQEWIPVTERLPDPWEEVLVYSRYDFCETAMYLGIPGKWRVTWNHQMLEVDSITHWMPLPELPKGDNDAESID